MGIQFVDRTGSVLVMFALIKKVQIPRRCVIGMVSHDAHTGSYKKSPFNFEHFNVREITISANGREYPAVPYNLDFAADKFVRAFHDMQESLSYAYSMDSNGISMNKFKSGWCLFVFNLTNNMEDDQCFDLIKNGTTSISIKFNEAVPALGISVIGLGEMDA